MRIYAVADIHGRSDKIALIRSNTQKLNPDVLVVAGDITNYTGSAGILAQLNDIPVPVLAVRGKNMFEEVCRDRILCIWFYCY